MRKDIARYAPEDLESEASKIAMIKRCYEKNGGGALAIRDIFPSNATLASVIAKLEEHKKAAENSRKAKSDSVFAMFHAIAGVFSEGVTASEKTIQQLKEAQLSGTKQAKNLYEEFKGEGKTKNSSQDQELTTLKQ